MNKVTINGREIEFAKDELVVVLGSTILVGNETVQSIDPGTGVKIEVVGDPLMVYSNRSVFVTGTVGAVDAMGSVTVGGDVKGKVSTSGGVEVAGGSGDIDTTGNVKVGGNCGSIDASGSVEVTGNCSGSIDTMGRVTVGSRNRK